MREICTFGSVRGGGGNIPAYSAQAVTEHVELTGPIADDNGVGQQAAGDDGADHGRLGDPPATASPQTEAVQMGLPGRLVGKAPALVAEQAGDHSFGNLVLNQVGESNRNRGASARLG